MEMALELNTFEMKRFSGGLIGRPGARYSVREADDIRYAVASFKKQGYSRQATYLRSLIAVETYIQDDYRRIFDEAWKED